MLPLPLLAPLQSLAVNLTLDEYRATLLTSSSVQQQRSSGPAATPPATLSHLTLTSADLDSMGLCSHCRYPCYLR